MCNLLTGPHRGFGTRIPTPAPAPETKTGVNLVLAPVLAPDFFKKNSIKRDGAPREWGPTGLFDIAMHATNFKMTCPVIKLPLFKPTRGET